MKVLNLRYLLIILLLAINLFCLGQKIPILTIADAYKNQETVTTKEFIESFTYVTLETSPQCLIGGNPKIFLTDNAIVITDQENQCLLFEKATGKFIRKIGHYGKDPGGYRTTRGFFNESTSTIYFQGWKNNLIKYSLDGNEIGSIPVPGVNSSFTDSYIPDSYDYLDNNLIVCNIDNNNGIQKTLIMIFDEKGKEVKKVPNTNLIKEHKFSLSIGDVKFSHFNGKLFYNQIYNDTIFQLQLEKVVPHLILKKRKYKVTRENRRSDKERISVANYFESDNFFILDFWNGKKQFFTLYNKTNLKLKVCEFTLGIKNMTDNFLPFYPKAIYKEELVGIVQANDIISWVDTNKDASEKVNPQLIKKLGSIKPTDNPVIMIGKLKN